eukprot:gene9487-biopygen10735
MMVPGRDDGRGLLRCEIRRVRTRSDGRVLSRSSEIRRYRVRSGVSGRNQVAVISQDHARSRLTMWDQACLEKIRWSRALVNVRDQARSGHESGRGQMAVIYQDHVISDEIM